MPTDITPLLTGGAALVAVLALIWVAGRLARATGLGAVRRTGRAGSRALAVEEVLALDQRRRLLLVRCAEGRVLLLTGGTDLVVGWLPPERGVGAEHG